jgi:hypothetical protein
LPIFFQATELSRSKGNYAIERPEAVLNASLQDAVGHALAVDKSGGMEGIRIKIHRPPKDFPRTPAEQLGE